MHYSNAVFPARAGMNRARVTRSGIGRSVPARAGMNRWRPSARRSSRRVPRTRGDEPTLGPQSTRYTYNKAEQDGAKQ